VQFFCAANDEKLSECLLVPPVQVSSMLTHEFEQASVIPPDAHYAILVITRSSALGMLFAPKERDAQQPDEQQFSAVQIAVNVVA
jgi:hypothetical protein